MTQTNERHEYFPSLDLAIEYASYVAQNDDISMLVVRDFDYYYCFPMRSYCRETAGEADNEISAMVSPNGSLLLVDPASVPAGSK